jgi:copper resistance protein D
MVRIAALYEWTFWAAAGTLAMTGVGNLGAFGTALPPPQTGWGTTLTIKLGFVVLLVVLSLPRTLAVARLALGAASSAAGPLRALYGTTTVVFGTIAALAVWLAHG